MDAFTCLQVKTTCNYHQRFKRTKNAHINISLQEHHQIARLAMAQGDLEQASEPLLENRGAAQSNFWDDLLWYGLLLLTHVLWGLYPVSCRYLETKTVPPLGPMRLGFYVAFIALLALFFTVTLPAYLKTLLSSTPAHRPVEHDGDKKFWEKLAAIVVLSFTLGVLAFGGIVATNFTSANWCQLLYMTAPLFVALLGAAVLGVPIPWFLWPSLLITIVGAGMVVFGSQTGDAEFALGPRDFIGLSIAFACVLAMAVFYVYVQKTEGLIGVEVILYVEYLTMCIALPGLSAAFEGSDWDAILHYTWADWTNLLFASLGVYFGMNMLQQLVIRRLGASIFAMSSALRLVATIAGSWIILDEQITNWIEWLGALLVMLSVTFYLYMQFVTTPVSDSPDAVADAREEEAVLLADSVGESVQPLVRRASSVALGQKLLRQASVSGTPGSVPMFFGRSFSGS
eukprot:jgi/Botrbrau1/19700/Bobra.0003s0061.1